MRVKLEPADTKMFKLPMTWVIILGHKDDAEVRVKHAYSYLVIHSDSALH